MPKILWYNPFNIKYIYENCSDYIIDYKQLDKLRKIVDETPIGPLDRTGKVSVGFDIKLCHPVPEINNFNKSLFDICLDRAKQLIDTGEMLNLYWSGGIDSTCALVSFINAGVHKDQLRILSRVSCIDEYELFFKKFIVAKYYIKLYERETNPYFESYKFDGILMTGDHGDQLFGSAVAVNLCQQNDGFTLDMPYEQCIIPEFHDLFNPLFEDCPIEIKTMQDYYWWINFITKWHDALYRTNAYTSRNEEKVLNPFVAFYNTDDFQRWALCNHEKKAGSTLESYKMPLKDIIYDFTKDAMYRDYKLKAASVMFNASDSLAEYDWDVLFIDEDMNFVRKQK